jgi:signal transduction histidine kinase
MAHDLRNLLGVFDQNIQFVQQALEEVEEELPDTIEEDIEQVQEATERVLSYVQRVHELAHILQGPWNPESGSDVFLQGIEGVPEASESRVRRLIEVEEGLPDVRLDAPRVKLLAQELLSNVDHAGATQAKLRVASTPPENPLVQAWAEALPAGPHVFLSCTDDGSGMDVFVLSRCGEPMFSHPPGVDRPGLGFSLIRSILGAVGGQMSVTAVRGQGSTVTLAFPAAAHPGPVSAGEVVPLVPESERLKVAVRLPSSSFRDWLLETLVDAQFEVVEPVL